MRIGLSTGSTLQLIIGRHQSGGKSVARALSDIETAAGIRSNRFPAEPTYLACSYYPYRSICPAQRSDGGAARSYPAVGRSPTFRAVRH